MEDSQSVVTLMDSTTSKIQQLQKAFAELESHRAVTLNMKWKQLEEHFHGLEKSLKRRFTELEDQEKEFESKIVQSKEMLENREAAVVAKEQASLVRLQEKRDAAISAITIALDKHRNPFSAGPTVNFEDQVDSCVVEEKSLDATTIVLNVGDYGKLYETGNVEVKSYPELVKLCKEMDSDGLHKFISDNRKNLAAIREEIPLALTAAADPASLVLDSLKGFYNLEMSNLEAKKDANLLGIRRTCIMLMECLNMLLTNVKMGSVLSSILENVKDRAKAIAEEWKPKLDELDADANHGNSLEAHAFLQLVDTFGINSDFDQEGLIKLIPMVSRRRQTADLCRSLGLSDKMPGVINVLVNNGRHIDAVNLAFAFELTEQFPPVSLLKSYLNEASKASPSKSGNASNSQNDIINEKELNALKAVIKCIEDHKLDEQYPVDPLQKRVHHLEKAKADSKRGTEVAKPQPKRPRANGFVNGPRATNIATDKNIYAPRMTMTDRYPQYVYDRPPYAYTGPTDTHVPQFLGTPAYSLSGHGNFFGNGYHYQAAYLH
nr:FRIGIDA-like protein 3 [Ipomoea batatas]